MEMDNEKSYLITCMAGVDILNQDEIVMIKLE
jgi:hypothetical protein